MPPGAGAADDAISSSSDHFAAQQPESPRMANVISLRGSRPVATVPSTDSYRTSAAWLVTFAGFVRPAAVTVDRADRADRPAVATKAA
jgi:hypothetical protein